MEAKVLQMEVVLICHPRAFSERQFMCDETPARALAPGPGRRDLGCGHVPYWLLVLISRALLPAPRVAWGPAVKDGLGFWVGQHARAVLRSLRSS